VIEFLNLPIEHEAGRASVKNSLARHVPPGRDGAEVQRADGIQKKWSRLLHPLIEPMSDAKNLRESFHVGIAVHDGLIHTQQRRIAGIEQTTGSDSEVRILRQQLGQLQTNKAKMEQHVKLDDTAILCQTVREDLRGAECVTQEDALKQVVTELNLWSLNRSIHPTWRLTPDLKTNTRRRHTRGVWRHEGKPCTVEQRIAPGKILTNPDDSRPIVGLEDVLCVHVARILETGELGSLRRCQLQRCRHVFFAYKSTKTHCSPDHQREHDQQSRALIRVRLSRMKSKAELKKYALAILPTLSIRSVRALVSKGILKDWVIDAVDEMLEQVGNGTNLAQVWARSKPRTRALFKTLKAHLPQP
jgi:hypothetical protein